MPETTYERSAGGKVKNVFRTKLKHKTNTLFEPKEERDPMTDKEAFSL
jgi:hypothetical protein